MEHINRRGVKYTIFCGQTKTGKPKFFASSKSTSEAGEPVEALPSDFEIFESPENSTVTVRKKKESAIKEADRQFLQQTTETLSESRAVQVVIDGNYLVVYAGENIANSGLSRALSGMDQYGFMQRQVAEYSRSHGPLTAMLRFELVNSTKGWYRVERYCFRSSLEGWLSLHDEGTLDTLAIKYLPHVGAESFYELM